MPVLIELKNISKLPFFENVSFSFDSKEEKIISVYGSEASSLTTLLKIISGIEKPDTGEILYNGTTSVPNFPFIPMKPSSFPWLSVKGNVEIVPARKKESNYFINLVGLSGYEDYHPNEKSIGFRFRISLARALSLEPSLILLDNCFESADQETKDELILLLKSISEELNITFLYSSLNLSDIIKLSGEIIILKQSAFAEKFTLTGNTNSDMGKLLKVINAG